MMLGAWRCSGHEIAGVIDCRAGSRPDWRVGGKHWTQAQILARWSDTIASNRAQDHQIFIRNPKVDFLSYSSYFFFFLFFGATGRLYT